MKQTKIEKLEDDLVAEEMNGKNACPVCGGWLVTDRESFWGCRSCHADYVMIDKKLQRIKISAITNDKVEYEFAI